MDTTCAECMHSVNRKGLGLLTWPGGRSTRRKQYGRNRHSLSLLFRVVRDAPRPWQSSCVSHHNETSAEGKHSLRSQLCNSLTLLIPLGNSTGSGVLSGLGDEGFCWSSQVSMPRRRNTDIRENGMGSRVCLFLPRCSRFEADRERDFEKKLLQMLYGLLADYGTGVDAKGRRQQFPISQRMNFFRTSIVCHKQWELGFNSPKTKLGIKVWANYMHLAKRRELGLLARPSVQPARCRQCGQPSDRNQNQELNNK